MHDQIKKIEVIRNEAERLGKDLFIEVDGGIDNKTSKDVIAAGANVLVAGNYVFKNDYAKAIRVLKGAP
jgi:ribulose-phosphate 3-epimerase